MEKYTHLSRISSRASQDGLKPQGIFVRCLLLQESMSLEDLSRLRYRLDIVSFLGAPYTYYTQTRQKVNIFAPCTVFIDTAIRVDPCSLCVASTVSDELCTIFRPDCQRLAVYTVLEQLSSVLIVEP